MHILKIYLFILPIMILFISNSCAADDEVSPAWSYDDDYTGQEDWGAIKGYEICEFGTNQSPINISYTKTSNISPLNFKYNKADGIIKLTNKSFVMEVANGGKIIDGENSYILQSIELHSPSSHRIRDNYYPAEIHLIHKNTQGDLLIIAVFANIGDTNSAIETMLKEADARNTNKFTITSDALVPTSNTYYAYSGSLPYPPCTENVRWRILKKTITISQEQLAKIGRYIGRNTRLPQPVYMREVLETE